MSNQDFIIPRRDGLVAEFLLDGNALDTSGNGNNGTATNVTYATTYRGYQSQKGVFNGSNAYVNFGDPASLDFTSSFSLAFTIKPNAQPGTGLWHRWFDNTSGGSPYGVYCGYLDTSGTKKLELLYGASARSSVNYTLANSQTYHVVFVHDDASDTDYIYVDGQVVLTQTGRTANPVAQTGNKYLMCEGGTGKFTNADCQAFRAFNRALSASEIRNWYLEGLRALGGSTLAGLMDGCVAYYDMRGDANDIVGGNNGTVTGATLTTDRFGNANSAYAFDGNDYVSRTSPMIGGGATQPFTLSVIFKINALPTTSFDLIMEQTAASGISRLIRYNNNAGTYRLQGFAGGVNYNAPTYNVTLSTGTYYRADYSFNGTTGRLFLNGVEVASDSTVPTVTVNSSAYSSVGAYVGFGQTSGVNFLNGTVDEALWMNVSKSSTEIKASHELSSRDKLLPFE